MKPPRLGREVLKRGALNINELVAPTGFDRQTCFRLFRSSDSRRPRSDARELGADAGPAPLLPSSPLDWHAKRVGKREEGELRSEEHTSELQSRPHLVCRLLLEKKKK